MDLYNNSLTDGIFVVLKLTLFIKVVGGEQGVLPIDVSQTVTSNSFKKEKTLEGFSE